MPGIVPLGRLPRQRIESHYGSSGEQKDSQERKIRTVAKKQCDQRADSRAVAFLAMSLHRWPHLTADSRNTGQGHNFNGKAKAEADQYREHPFEDVDERSYDRVYSANMVPEFDVDIARGGVGATGRGQRDGKRECAQKVAADYQYNRTKHPTVTRCPRPLTL